MASRVPVRSQERLLVIMGRSVLYEAPGAEWSGCIGVFRESGLSCVLRPRRSRTLSGRLE